MTELKTNQDWQEKTIHNYFVVYYFRNKLTNLAFEDLIAANFKRYYISDNCEFKSSFYLSLPLNREIILHRFNNIISQIKTDIENSDFLYIVSNLSSSLNNTEKEKFIISGHDIITGQNKIWPDIVSQYQRIISMINSK